MTDGSGKSPTPFVSRIRGTANVLTLLGSLVFLVGLAMHWPAWILGRLALFLVTTFLVSFVSIMIENRRAAQAEQTDEGGSGSGGPP